MKVNIPAGVYLVKGFKMIRKIDIHDCDEDDEGDGWLDDGENYDHVQLRKFSMFVPSNTEFVGQGYDCTVRMVFTCEKIVSVEEFEDGELHHVNSGYIPLKPGFDGIVVFLD